MTLQEKILYHQIHPLKLVTDIFTSVLSTYLLWIQNELGFWITFLIPSLVATLLVIRFANLERLKASRSGRYIRRFMTKKIEILRLAGQIIVWFSAWHHFLFGVLGGVAVISMAWVSGVLGSKQDLP